MSSPSNRASIRSTSSTTAFRSTTRGAKPGLAAERQELPGQRSRPLAGPVDFVHRLFCGARVRGGERGGHEVRVPGDDGEQVVEVVGHPARELADRFHLLRPAATALQPPARGHVVDGHGGQFDRPVGPPDRRPR